MLHHNKIIFISVDVPFSKTQITQNLYRLTPHGDEHSTACTFQEAMNVMPACLRMPGIDGVTGVVGLNFHALSICLLKSCVNLQKDVF